MSGLGGDAHHGTVGLLPHIGHHRAREPGDDSVRDGDILLYEHVHQWGSRVKEEWRIVEEIRHGSPPKQTDAGKGKGGLDQEPFYYSKTHLEKVQHLSRLHDRAVGGTGDTDNARVTDDVDSGHPRRFIHALDALTLYRRLDRQGDSLVRFSRGYTHFSCFNMESSPSGPLSFPSLLHIPKHEHGGVIPTSWRTVSRISPTYLPTFFPITNPVSSGSTENSIRKPAATAPCTAVMSFCTCCSRFSVRERYSYHIFHCVGEEGSDTL